MSTLCLQHAEINGGGAWKLPAAVTAKKRQLPLNAESGRASKLLPSLHLG